MTELHNVKMRLNGYLFIDSTKIKLGQLINKKGQSILFDYDLGDHYLHNIEIERVISGDEADGSVEVIDGGMACPPEDSNGLDGSGSYGYTEMCAAWPTMTKAERKKVKKGVLTSTNYKGKDFFDPWLFDIDECRARVQEAISSKQSVCLWCVFIIIALNRRREGITASSSSPADIRPVKKGEK